MKRSFTIVSILLFVLMSFLHAQTRDLTYYINQSLENSPVLKDYQNKLVINQLDSLILKADYKPQVDFSSYDHLSPIIDGYGYDYAIYKRYHITAVMTVRQTIIGRENMKTRFNVYALDTVSHRRHRRLPGSLTPAIDSPAQPAFVSNSH